MTEQPIVRSQRFFPLRLGELVDKDSIPVQEYARRALDVRDLADNVIKDITYPMNKGIPDDLHIFNCFHGKWCKRIDLDYWSKASETATKLIGDCEDSSILFVAGARRWLGTNMVYEVFGVVKDTSGKVLGGHGWAVANWTNTKSGEYSGFRLIESTLDVPPEEYPIVPDIEKPFQMGDWVYEPSELWNDMEYRVIGAFIKGYPTYAASLGYRSVLWSNHGNFGKDTIAKYEALEKMWQQTPKPLREMRKKRNALKRRVFFTGRKV